MRKLKRNLDAVLIALFLVMVGFGAPLFIWAATQIGSSQIKDQAITNPKVAPGISAEKIGVDTTVSNTEFKALDGVTSGIQGQINGKEPTISAGTITDYWRGDKTWHNLDSMKGDTGATGPPGADGAKGDTGPQGPQGLAGSGGGGIGKSSSTPGRLVEWTASDTIGDASNTNTEVAAAVSNSHAGSHSGTAGKIPMFTGTNVLGDSGLTDTQLRTEYVGILLLDPSSLTDSSLLLIDSLQSAVTILGVSVKCDTSIYEIAGNVQWGNDYIDRASGDTVINDFDTTSGTRTDTSITSALVPIGKCIYLRFDSQPPAGLRSVLIGIYYMAN